MGLMKRRKDGSFEYESNGVTSEKGNLSGAELRKRKRVVRRTKALFKAIDVLFSLPQNSCPYINKHNAKEIKSDTDIVYAEDLAEVGMFDFYRDSSEDKLPAIILIHGGGFTAGDKKYRKGRAMFFAIHGFAVFCVNYGLAPKYIFPEPIKHIVSASNFIYDNAERFNIDTERIFIGGDSAGAYYAAMISGFNCSDKLSKAFSCSPKFRFFGTLLNCGVYDICKILNAKLPLNVSEGVMLSLTGERTKHFENYKYKDVCAPVDFVNADYPPTFLIFSDNDIFCGGQGDVMIDKLEECGVYYEYYAARDAMSNHCFSLTWTGEDAAAANELLLSFAMRLANDKIKLR